MEQLDHHVRQRRAGEHALVDLLKHVDLDQPLPVQGQLVHVAQRFKANAAAPGAGDQPQLHLGVVAQGLVVAHPHRGGGDGLHVQHPHRPEVDLDAEALAHQLADDLQLDAAHHPQVDAAGGLVHRHRQRRVLVLQRAQGFEHLARGHGAVPQGGGGHHGLGVKAVAAAARAEDVPGPDFGEPRRGAEHARLGPLQRGELRAAVQPQLVHPGRAPGDGEFLPGPQAAGEHLEEAHPAPLGVVADLVAQRAEGGDSLSRLRRQLPRGGSLWGMGGVVGALPCEACAAMPLDRGGTAQW